MTTFYLPLGTRSNWGNTELRFLLRSLDENFKDEFNVVIYGEADKPSWLRNVEFSIVDRYYPEWLAKERRNKIAYENYFCTLNKMRIWVNSEECPEEFVYIYDDVCLLRQIGFSEIQNRPEYLDVGNYEKRLGETRHGKTILSAYFLLKNKPRLNFESHMPRVYRKDKMAELFDMFDFEKLSIPYALATLYFGYYENYDMPTLKEHNEYKAGFYFEDESNCSFSSHSFHSINNAVEDKVWLNYNERGINFTGIGRRQYLKEWLIKRFPEKSKFEA